MGGENMAVHSKSSTPYMYEEWREFVNTGKIRSSSVRPEIAESWRRCVRAGVDPYGGVCKNILQREELENLLQRNRELIDISRPFLYKLYKFLKGSNFVVMLANAEGVIMEFFGDPYMDEEASMINFMKGGNWKEEYVGSTTIGIITRIKKPIQMTGAEHFCKKSHMWTCSAAPIFNATGDMIGIFNVSGPCSENHKHTLGMVVAAVEAIQYGLTIKNKNHELREISARMTNIFTSVSEAVVIIDKYGTIEQLNPVAEEIFGKNFIKGMALDELVVANDFARNEILNSSSGFQEIEATLKIESGYVECIVTGTPLKDENDHTNGMVIVIRPMEKVKSLVKRFSNVQAHFHFTDIIGKSSNMLKVIDIASKASESDVNVLLEGESGTGKEVFAQSIHNKSYRRKGPFIAVNCGAIPRELIGSELFGYSEGAFTGAKRGGRPGKFELASNGTIFLDEIGDMPLEQQVSLLRVLQERNIIRIGGHKSIPVDVRVICATHKDLLKEVEKGNFRKDLFYRLNVIKIKIPPLRERPEDIELLFRYFVANMGKKPGYDKKEISQDIFRYLFQYHWPGNVRELQNVVERMFSIANGSILTPSSLPDEIRHLGLQGNSDMESFTEKITLEEVRKRSKQVNAEKEQGLLKQLLIMHNGNITQISRELNVSRKTIYRKLDRYNLR